MMITKNEIEKYFIRTIDILTASQWLRVSNEWEPDMVAIMSGAAEAGVWE